MPKALTLAGLVISALLLIIFALDLTTSIPFGTPSSAFDIGMVISALAIGTLSWFTYRDVK